MNTIRDLRRRFLRQSIAASILCVLLPIWMTGCGDKDATPKPTSTPTPAVGNETVEYLMSIPLGAVRNRFYINKTVYLGWDVRSFKLQFKFYPMVNLPGVHIELLQGETLLQDVPKEPVPYGRIDFWTNEVNGNWVDLRIYSEDFVQFGDQIFQYLIITGAEINYDRRTVIEVPSESADQIKMANTLRYLEPVVSARRLNEESETIGLIRGLNPVQHYYFQGQENEKYLIYISPVVYETANSTALVVGMSTNGFIPVPAGTSSGEGILTPESGDTGILIDWNAVPGKTTLYLTVRQLFGSAVLISVNRIDVRYRINFEMEKDLSKSTPGKPTEEPSAYLTETYEALRPTIYAIWPFGYSEAAFASNSPSYLQRLKEMIVFFAADMLNATEGYFLVIKADIYKSTHFYLNSDVVIYNKYGRATGPQNKIHLYRNELDDPILGGAVLMHEWGHFKFDLPDEYMEDSPFIVDCPDPNTIMCSPRTSDAHTIREFCAFVNHPSAAGGKSDWEIIYEETKVAGPLYPDKSSSFHDVLNALNKLIVFEEHG